MTHLLGLRVVRGHKNCHKYHSQHRKDEGLYEPDDDLKHNKRDWEQKGRNSTDERSNCPQNYLSSKYITKKTKRKRDDFCKFSNQFQDTDEEINRVKREESA